APGGRDRAVEAARAADGEPGHPRRDGDAARKPLRRRVVDDRRGPSDRQGLRADRRAPARARRADRAHRELVHDLVRCRAMAATGQGRASARVNVYGGGETNVGTGLPVLDHLLTTLAVYGSFDLALEVEPGPPEVEI